MGQTKAEKKAQLFRWGGALDLCGRKQEEIRRLERLRREQRRLWEESDEPTAAEILRAIEEKYTAELQRIEAEIGRILAQKAEIDGMLEGMDREAREFVRMRFGKGYGYDYIALKLHMSRATVFRLQDRVLQGLGEIETQ